MTENPPGPSVGILTYLGVVTAIVGAVGSIVAALEGNDVATATAGLASLAATIRTIDARGAQAIALIERGAARALPFVEALAEGDQRELEAGDGAVDPDPPVSVRSV